MNPKNVILIALCLLLNFGCSVEKKQNKGLIVPQSATTKLNFTTNRTVIVLPVMYNGTPKNFAFDTGAELSVVHRDKISGKTTKVSGANGVKVKVGSETITTFKIGETIFEKIYALNANLDYLTKQIPDFGGIIGQSIICKANWLIDYPNNKIEISDKAIETVGFESIKIDKIRDPHADIIIEGETYSALIDLGSSVAMTIPEGSKLAEKLLAKYAFKDNTREVFRLSGAGILAEKVGTLPKAQLGNASFEAVSVNILPTSQLKLGNAFFKDYIMYIDNTNGVYKIKKTK